MHLFWQIIFSSILRTYSCYHFRNIVATIREFAIVSMSRKLWLLAYRKALNPSILENQIAGPVEDYNCSNAWKI